MRIQKEEENNNKFNRIKQKLRDHFGRHKKKYAVGLFVFVIVFLLGFMFVYRPAVRLKNDVYAMRSEAKILQKALKDKEYDSMKNSVDELDRLLGQTKNDYYYFSFLSNIPYIKDFYNDGYHGFAIADEGILIAKEALVGLEPYKDIIGFSADKKQSLSTEEQLLQIAQISPQLIPLFDSTEAHLTNISKELDMIDISKYPEEFRGIMLHDYYEKASTYIRAGNEVLNNIEPILPHIPTALGEPEPQTYLLLFQNDKELRPTGGFITAYALVEFRNGKFKIIKSDDIYDLNAPENILPAPLPILQYLKVNSYKIRDANFSPDFQKSMDDFMAFGQYTSLPDLAGIISLDTQFVERMIEVTGPIDMPQYSLDFSGYPTLPEACKEGGTVFTAENVVCRLELYAEKLLKGTEDRKQILGDLMEHLVDRILKMKAAELPAVLEAIGGELNQKHVLISLENSELQQFVEKYNWGGRIREIETTDYLHINDSNLAGLKSDFYLIRTVNQEVTVQEDGAIEKKLTLTYENPEPQDGWLNAVARNYVRVYVPQGSELVSFTGDITREPNVYDDLGKTVFDNFILIPPLESRTVEIVYRLPGTFTGDEYSILIQKQPGKDEIPHRLVVNGIEQEFGIKTDEEIRVNIE